MPVKERAGGFRIVSRLDDGLVNGFDGFLPIVHRLALPLGRRLDRS